jgi:hypothetical protein
MPRDRLYGTRGTHKSDPIGPISLIGPIREHGITRLFTEAQRHHPAVAPSQLFLLDRKSKKVRTYRERSRNRTKSSLQLQKDL